MIQDQSPEEGTSSVTPPKRMLSITKTDTGVHVHINPSSLSLLQTCPRKAYYTLHRGLVPLERSAALTFGTAIHAALEVFYRSKRSERVLPNNYAENMALMCSGQQLPNESDQLIYRATRAFINEAAPLAHLDSLDKRSHMNGGWLLSEYFESRLNDPYEILLDPKTNEPLAERLLEHELHTEPGLTITLFGTVDAIFENKATGQVLVADHKTSSVVGNSFYNRTKPNHQYTAYVYLAQKVLGINTDNFLINCFQVKARPKTTRGAGPNFLHLVTKRSPEDIAEFKETVVYYVKQYLAWTNDGFWPYGPVDACASYGKCGYLNICSSPTSIKENIIGAEYAETK